MQRPRTPWTRPPFTAATPDPLAGIIADETPPPIPAPTRPDPLAHMIADETPYAPPHGAGMGHQPFAPEVPYFRRDVRRPTQWPMEDTRPGPPAKAVNEHLGKVLVGLKALELEAAYQRRDQAIDHGGDVDSATRAVSAAEAGFNDARYVRDLNKNSVTSADQVQGYQGAVDLLGHKVGEAMIEATYGIAGTGAKAAKRVPGVAGVLTEVPKAAKALANLSDRIEARAQKGETRRSAITNAVQDVAAHEITSHVRKAIHDVLKPRAQGAPTPAETPP